MVIRRFDVCLVPLDPTVGTEMRKTRPCVVISPDEMNRVVRPIIVAPLTTVSRSVPYRVPCVFDGTTGQVALDHIRAVDRTRVHKSLGQLDDTTAENVRQALLKLFG